MATDINVLSTRMLSLLLYPIVGWAGLVLVFYMFGHIGWGIVACFPLALWLGGLGTWWAVTTRARLGDGEVTESEVSAGVRTIGHIFAGASSTPAMVFLANDPFASTAWSTAVGVGVVSMAAYLLTTLATRQLRGHTLALALALSWLALPVNATGAVTVASMLGWYDTVAERTPIPERRVKRGP